MKVLSKKKIQKIPPPQSLPGQRTFAFALPVLFLLIFSFPVLAQNTIRVKGRITSENNQPMPGASVLVKGTSTGVTSDESGNFEISAPRRGTLVISSVGFATKEVSVNGQSTLNIGLTTGTHDLDQVVVVGYGTQRKRDLTGSVASVNLEALGQTPNTNIGQYLQGTVPGLNVGLSTFAGGTPPISIRGINTISGNQNVLIILDGIQYNQSLSSINPDDIASIDVLKDASSTAVYGAQAANGVILITTRKGRNSAKNRITFSSSYSTQEPTVDLRPMNRQEYLESLREGFWNNGTNPSYLPDGVVPNPNFRIESVVDATMATPGRTALLPNDFNWWKEGTNTGQIYEVNLGISGGSDRFNYLLSGGLVNQKGVIINDKFKRKSIRANLEVKPLNWWKVGLVSSGSFVNQDGAEPTMFQLLSASPLQTPFDSTGKLIPFPTGTINPNPFNTYYVDDYERHNYLFANVYSEIDFPFLKGLNYRVNFGNNYRTSNRFGSSIYAANLTGEAFKNNTTYYDYTFDNILTYTRNFGKHGVTATLLYGAIERQSNFTGARATGFSRLNPLSYHNLAQGANQFVTSSDPDNTYREALNYQMARVNYRFNDKYLLTATIRRDGFSGFAENFKYAYFPSLGVGWNISDESFMQNVKQVNLLKLRATYGVIGNQTSRYQSIARVNTGAAYVFGDGGTTSFGQQVAALGNPDLKWERTKGINLGLDFTILNRKLSGTFDYYRNTTKDLLYSVVIPSITGFNSIQTNLGELLNQGIEASLTYNVINKTEFRWSSTLNFWRNTNKIVTLTGIDANGDGKEDDIIGSNLFIGRTLNTIYYYENDHIYQMGETPLSGFMVGSMALVDQDKDGKITPDKDRVFRGDRNPAYRFSWINQFDYKGFSLMVFFNSIQGGKNGYLGDNTRSYFLDDNQIRNNDLVQIDYWSPSNPDGKYPRITRGTQPAQQPQYWESRSFIRLQDLSISYNLGRLVKKANFQALNFYVSGKNLFTWTDWSGWDPEAVRPNSIDPYGLVIDPRPTLRTFTVGLNITY